MNQNKKKLEARIHTALFQQLEKNGFATPVQLLLDLGVLEKADYTAWRHGKVDYLERVCKANLSKLSAIQAELRSYAHAHNLRPAWTSYKAWGVKGKSKDLRFSKSGLPALEKNYATHYLSPSLKGKSKKAEQ